MIKIAKVALENKTTNFDISCKHLTKNFIYKRRKNILFPSSIFPREITEPLMKIKLHKNFLLWLHEYIQSSDLSSALMLPSAFLIKTERAFKLKGWTAYLLWNHICRLHLCFYKLQWHIVLEYCQMSHIFLHPHLQIYHSHL